MLSTTARDPAVQVKLDELRRAYEPRTLLACVMGYALVTALGQGLTYWFDPASLDGPTGVVMPWLVVLPVVPLLFVLSRQFAGAQGVARLPPLFWPQQLLVLLWLATLAWYTMPAFAALLSFVLVGLVFNDVSYLFDARGLKLVYAGVWPLQLLLLGAVDVCGGPGVLARFARDESRVWLTVVTELCLLVLLQVIIRVVGRNHFEKEEGYRAAGRLQAELRAMETERGVFARSCDFLLHGLSATRFSHDVASPLSVLRVTLHTLNEQLDEQLPDRNAELLRLTDRMALTINRLETMARTMSRSLRQPGHLKGVDALELIQGAIEYARQTLEQHRAELRVPSLVIGAGDVFVSAEHTSALASIITNSALEAPDMPLSLLGEPIDELFYRFQIRDWGVQGQERVHALRAIEQSMATDTASRGSEPRRSGRYEGHGIGLLMTKVLIVRSGGWISAHPPEDGRGICFSVVLPRRDPAQIPLEQNHPERLGAEAQRLNALSRAV